MRYIIISLFVIVSCAKQSKTSKIYIQFDSEKLIVEQVQINVEDFERELKKVIETKLKEGFKKEELIVDFKIDKNARIGDVASIQTVMRRLNIKKIVYSDLNEELPQT